MFLLVGGSGKPWQVQRQRQKQSEFGPYRGKRSNRKGEGEISEHGGMRRKALTSSRRNRRKRTSRRNSGRLAVTPPLSSSGLLWAHGRGEAGGTRYAGAESFRQHHSRHPRCAAPPSLTNHEPESAAALVALQELERGQGATPQAGSEEGGKGRGCPRVTSERTTSQGFSSRSGPPVSARRHSPSSRCLWLAPALDRGVGRACSLARENQSETNLSLSLSLSLLGWDGVERLQRERAARREWGAS
jgi:hypothetical protein